MLPFTSIWEKLIQIVRAFMLPSFTSLHFLPYSLGLTHTHTLTHTHLHLKLVSAACERSQYVSIVLSVDSPLLRLVSMVLSLTCAIQNTPQLSAQHGVKHQTPDDWDAFVQINVLFGKCPSELIFMRRITTLDRLLIKASSSHKSLLSSLKYPFVFPTHFCYKMSCQQVVCFPTVVQGENVSLIRE